jgi:predicted dehydrogenase
MFNIGFAGFRHGHIYALYNLAAQNKNVNIAGAWEEDDAARKTAMENFDVAFTHKIYKEMLEDKNIDIIAIGNYFGARGQMVIEALEAGKHVMVDKPLCTSMKELEEIEKIAGRTGLKVGLMLEMRYHENILAAKGLIESGEIGTVHNIYFGGQHPLNYGARPDWYYEEGKHGGVINDIAIHGIDLVRFMTGLEVEEVLAARCWNAYAAQEKHFKDSGQMMLKLGNHAGVIADVSYALPNSFGFSNPYYWLFKLWGDKGLIAFTANSDGVELFKDGETKVRIVKGQKPDTDYLTDFLREIQNELPALNTAEVLKSSKSTLQIQIASERFF